MQDLRAGDADRQRVGDRLRDALNEGRINLTEYDERLQEAYSAKTYGELDKLLDDLPATTPTQQAQLATARTSAPAEPTPAGQPAKHHGRGWLVGIWGGWISASLICTSIWAATSITAGTTHAFWPIWVIVPFGATCVVRTIRVMSDDTDHRDTDSRQADRREDRQRRDERRDRRRDRR